MPVYNWYLPTNQTSVTIRTTVIMTNGINNINAVTVITVAFVAIVITIITTITTSTKITDTTTTTTRLLIVSCSNYNKHMHIDVQNSESPVS